MEQSDVSLLLSTLALTGRQEVCDILSHLHVCEWNGSGVIFLASVFKKRMQIDGEMLKRWKNQIKSHQMDQTCWTGTNYFKSWITWKGFYTHKHMFLALILCYVLSIEVWCFRLRSRVRPGTRSQTCVCFCVVCVTDRKVYTLCDADVPLLGEICEKSDPMDRSVPLLPHAAPLCCPFPPHRPPETQLWALRNSLLRSSWIPEHKVTERCLISAAQCLYRVCLLT